MGGDPSQFEYGPAFDAADIGMIVLDDERRIAAWNEWIARVSGHSKRSVAGKTFYEVFPEMEGSRLRSVIDDSFEFGSSSILVHSLNTLLPLRNEAGRELLHNIVVRPMEARGSKYCLLQVNDVTVVVTRERILRQRQNARYRAIVDTAPDAIITASEDGTIQWLNGEAERTFGYGPDSLLGKKIDDLLASGSNLSHGFFESASERPALIQVVGRRKGGQKIRFDVSFSRWVADDRIFITTIWRDVTDLVEAQDALRKSNEALEARVAERTRERETALNQLHESQKMESIGQLTGGMAHDFNNLLAVISGNLALLKKSLPSDSRTDRLLDGAIQGAERGATLTKRLLAFARRQELKIEAVEIQQLVPDMLDFLRQSVGPNITIVVDIPPDVQPVSIDANQLELALMNLVLNARDAMPDGGLITITSRNETRGHKLPKGIAPGEYVCLSISDTGEGMDETTLARAKEPFFTTKGIGKGTGLGLPMVHGLTAQAGGAMHITSELGRGTVVSLWLPRAEARPEPNVSETVVHPRPAITDRKLRVLVVDDDMLVRMGTADMLTDLGHNVVEAASATRALQILEADTTFDVVITDYAMPGMSGLDLALKLEQINPELLVVLASGYAELPSRAAPVHFPRLGKPFNQAQLANVLQSAGADSIAKGSWPRPGETTGASH